MRRDRHQPAGHEAAAVRSRPGCGQPKARMHCSATHSSSLTAHPSTYILGQDTCTPASLHAMQHQESCAAQWTHYPLIHVCLHQLIVLILSLCTFVFYCVPTSAIWCSDPHCSQRDIPADKYSNAFLGYGPEETNFAGMFALPLLLAVRVVCGVWYALCHSLCCSLCITRLRRTWYCLPHTRAVAAATSAVSDAYSKAFKNYTTKKLCQICHSV